MADGHVIIDTKLDESGLRRGLAGLGNTLVKGMTAAVTAAGTALAGLGAYSVKVGSDFEYAMSGVAATMGKTVEELEEVSAKAKELGATTKFTATEAADAFNILGMAGLSIEEQLQAIDSTLRLAAAGEMEMEAAAGYLTTTVKAMSASFREAGINMEDTAHIADLYAKGATLANTSTAELAEAVNISASVGGAYNQSLDTLTVSLLALAERGYQGSQAGNYLARAMSDLYAPTDHAKKALDELGVSIYDSSGNQRDFIEIINDLNAAFATMTEEQRAAYTGTIFTSVGLRAFNSIATTSTEQLGHFREELENCTGAAEKMAETKLDNLQGDIVLLESATEGFGIALYEAMTKVDDAPNVLREFVQEAASIMEELEGAVKEGGFSGLVDALGGALARAVNKIVEYAPMLVEGGIKVVESFVQGLSQSAGTISSAATSLISVLIEGVLGTYNSLVVLGSEVVIALCNGIAENAGSIATVFAEGLTQLALTILEYIPLLIEAGVSMVVALVEGVLEALPVLIEAIPVLIETVINGLLGAIPNIIEAVIAIFNAIIAALPDLVLSIVGMLPTLIGQIITAILTLAPMLVECALKLVLAVVQALPQIIQAVISQIPRLIGMIIDAIIKCLPDLLLCVLDIILAIVEYLPQIILNIVAILPSLISSIVAGLIDCLPMLIACVLDLVIGIANALPDIIIKIVEILPTLILSIVKGLLDNVGMLISCAAQMIAAVAGALPQLFIVIVNGLVNLVISLATSVKNLWTKFKEAAKEWITKLWEGIKEKWDWLISSITGFFKQIPEKIKQTLSGISEIGRNLVIGIWNGISNATQWVLDKIKGFGRSILNGIKRIFGISSPSTVFRDIIGKNLAEGLAIGISDNADLAVKAAEELANDLGDIDYELGDIEPPPDYGSIERKLKYAVSAETSLSGTHISAGLASSSYRHDSDRNSIADTLEPQKPQYVENNIYIDGKQTARVITPYVSKELEWEGK